MQKVISFDKNLEFKTMIGDISSISLDQDLSFTDDSTISGELVVSGKYKLTAASRLEEDFSFHLPIEIVLTEKLEEETRKVSIEDFRYEIQEDDSILCHIELLIEGVEIIDVVDDTCLEDSLRSVEEDRVENDTKIIRECDGDEGISSDMNTVALDTMTVDTESISNNEPEFEEVNSKTVAIAAMEGEPEKKLNKEEKEASREDVTFLFSSFKDSDETFATYSVYIFRQNDTIEMIMDKYQVTKEELESYNDLSNLSIGSKVIIPTHNHE